MNLDRLAPRKNVQQSRARQTVDAILQASARIMAHEGFGVLTTNRIAEIAGVSVGSLYQYFPTKDAVILALMEREFNRTIDGYIRQIEAIDTRQVPLEEAVRMLVDMVFEHQVVRRPLYRQLLFTMLTLHHLRFTVDNDARVLACVKRKLLEYGDQVDQGALEPSTFVALYALKGVQLGTVMTERPADDPAMRERMVAMVMGAIRPRRHA